MNSNLNSFLKSSLLVSSLVCGFSVQAANLSGADYDAGKARINGAYKTDRDACGSLSGNAKDICVEEAKAKEKVGRAELDYNHTGKAGDMTKLRKVQADTAYDVAKEKCDDKAGNEKDLCQKEAKAARDKALADAKLGKEVNEAQKDATQDKRNADYSVAEQKCASLAGNAKDACVAQAKSQFGK